LQARLIRAGFESGQIAEALAGLEAAGLIDDERFARELVRSQTGRLSGARAIRHALRQKGVATDLVDAALEGAGDETQRAAELARQRAHRMHGLPPEVRARRLSDLLMRRGYGYEVTAEAVRTALAECFPSGDPSGPEGENRAEGLQGSRARRTL
jgi:regulatory protein